jgi:hypothetical protein
MEDIETQIMVPESQVGGALFHLQMFAECTLRNLSWGVRRLADKVWYSHYALLLSALTRDIRFTQGLDALSLSMRQRASMRWLS